MVWHIYNRRLSIKLVARFLSVAIVGLLVFPAFNIAQNLPTNGPVVGGVQLSAEGTLSARSTASTLKIPYKEAAAKISTAYVSLPRLLEKFSAVIDAKQKKTTELKNLGGLTRIDFVYLYPDQKDLVLANPAEPLDLTNPLQPVGKITGRPALQLDDLLMALRTVNAKTAKDNYGCSLDIIPDSQKISDEVVKKFGTGPRAKLLEEMKKAMGPQAVRIIGVPDTSRLALAMLAADYRLKCLSLGVEKFPLDGFESAITDSPAASRLWFSPQDEPLLVSEAGDA